MTTGRYMQAQDDYGLLHMVQPVGAQLPQCTKCNSPVINSQTYLIIVSILLVTPSIGLTVLVGRGGNSEPASLTV